MSTPINQLPPPTANTRQIAPQTSEDDQEVTDVIYEMEKEFSSSQPPQQRPQPQYTPQQSPPQNYQPHYSPPPNFTYNQQPYNKYYDLPTAKRAVICALVALVIFYPFELGLIYEKVPFLNMLQPYERAVRALLLAALIYVLLLKLNI